MPGPRRRTPGHTPYARRHTPKTPNAGRTRAPPYRPNRSFSEISDHLNDPVETFNEPVQPPREAHESSVLPSSPPSSRRNVNRVNYRALQNGRDPAPTRDSDTFITSNSSESFATARDGRPTIGERTASAPTGRQHAEGLPIITEEEDEVEAPSSHPSTDRPVIDHMPMEEIAPESEQQQRSSSEPIEPAHYSYILDLTSGVNGWMD
ncbi:hypothetical protein BJ546DRAFT_459397 [Cryomyces antarcticus]|uniref:Uncharacterized protein n=1 Tax=Cryomyces antarcticus TaxID=329879 RepID=A0ABR0LUK3_9PEZI|nr:hypothetical protein LTR60_007702 [Cryomyces antarcticus]KAK5003970.1 hypothetical protein LTR39_006284 [Cryomyces antarcticus]KAK5242420.1 hypothetical protein LTR16_008520 [Cryomyces antarcticus]